MDDLNKSLDEMRRDAIKELEERKMLSLEDRRKLEKKEARINNKIIKMLIDVEYEVSGSVLTYFSKNTLLRDLTKKDVFITTFSSKIFPMHMIGVYTDAESEEILYVQTGATNFVEIAQFLQK